MSKKIKSYNLSKDVIQAINNKANVDGRKDSDWLNRFLTMELITKTSLELKPIKAELVSDKKYIPMFDHFWDMYDKKKARPKCEGLWKKLTGKELELIFNNLPNYVLSTPDKQYRSNPETWLRNKGWNDEVIINEHRTNQSTGRKESSHERIKRENDVKYRGQNECGLAMGENDGHLGRTVGEGERELTIARLDNTDFIDY
jgi:hypothetical protein